MWKGRRGRKSFKLTEAKRFVVEFAEKTLGCAYERCNVDARRQVARCCYNCCEPDDEETRIIARRTLQCPIWLKSIPDHTSGQQESLRDTSVRRFNLVSAISIASARTPWAAPSTISEHLVRRTRTANLMENCNAHNSLVPPSRDTAVIGLMEKVAIASPRTPEKPVSLYQKGHLSGLDHLPPTSGFGRPDAEI